MARQPRKLYVSAFLGFPPSPLNPECFYKPELVNRRLRQHFGELPHQDDVRLNVWECDQHATPPTMKVVRGPANGRHQPFYVVEYCGDLPRTRHLGSPEGFNSLDDVFQRLKGLFLPGPEVVEFTDDLTVPMFPDPEDDRIVVWQCDPNELTMKVVWAFNGWHWQHDLPGMEDENVGYGTLPGCQHCLYKMACIFFRI